MRRTEKRAATSAVSERAGRQVVARRDLWICLGLVALSLAMAASALNNPLVFDDLGKIVTNPDLRSLANIPGHLIYPYGTHPAQDRNDPSRPLVFLLWTAIYAINGSAPFLYHLLNAVVHGVAACGVYLIGRRVQLRLEGRESRVVAGTAAALFAVAPIQMGSVIYAYGLSDVLSTALALASIWAILRADEPTRGDRAWSLLWMALALACKQSAVVVPALIAIIDWAAAPDLSLRAVATRWRVYAPHVVLVVCYLAARFMYFGGVGDLEAHGHAWPALGYASSEPWVVWHYLAETIVPVGLAIEHAVMPPDITATARATAFLAGVALVIAVIWRACRVRDVASRWMAFGLAWYLVTLAPTSSVLPTVDVMVERRVYIANVAVFLVAALGMEQLARRLKRAWAFPALAGTAFAALALVSLARNALFADPERMWRSVLAMYPDSQRAMDSLAEILSAQGDFTHAEAVFDTAVTRHPDDYVALGSYGYLMERGDNPDRNLPKALTLFEESAKADSSEPETYYNMGRIFQLEGRDSAADPLYRKTLQMEPDYVPAMDNLAVLDIEDGRTNEARALLDEALRIDPHDAPAQTDLQVLNGQHQ